MPILSRRSGIDERIALYPPELLAVFDDAFVTSFDYFDDYVASLVLEIFRTTGLQEVCGEHISPEEAVERLGFSPANALVPVSWILSMLASRKWIGAMPASDGRLRYRADRPMPDVDGNAILELQRAHDMRCLPSYELARLAAAHYPAVLRGQTSGEQALFGAQGIVPWVKYFSADNPLYAVSNSVGAAAAVHAAEVEASVVLEIGGGLGSGADTLLGELERAGRGGEVSRYCLTEISPLFLKRARRNLSAKHAATKFEFAELDIDLPFPPDVVAPGTHSLVYGVNVLHVARDLAATLGQLRTALRERGMLVMAECVRPFRNVPLPIELVFNLLDSFRNPVLDATWRPNGGFLTPEQWTAALAAHGFEDVRIYPDIASIRDAYPNFMAAAIVARRA